MKSLENILKTLNNVGFWGIRLESLLSNHLHGNYQMQYKMKNGEIVDAAIFFNNLIIPIDSKFSLENYNKMVQEEDAQRREAAEREFKADVKNVLMKPLNIFALPRGTAEFAFYVHSSRRGFITI